MLVGGAPLNEEFGKAVGADAYCRDAAVAAETAKALGQHTSRPAEGRAARPVGGLTSTDDGMTVAPLVIACGALASELRAVLEAQSALTDAVESHLSAGQLCTTGLSGSLPELEPLLDRRRRRRSPGVRRLRRLWHRWRTRRRCCERHPRRLPPAGIALLRVLQRLPSSSRRCTKKSSARSS